VSAQTFVVDADTAARATVSCEIEGTTAVSTDLAPLLGTNLAATSALVLSAPGTVHLSCEADTRFGVNNNVWLLTDAMTALQVQNVVFQ